MWNLVLHWFSTLFFNFLPNPHIVINFLVTVFFWMSYWYIKISLYIWDVCSFFYPLLQHVSVFSTLYVTCFCQQEYFFPFQLHLCISEYSINGYIRSPWLRWEMILFHSHLEIRRWVLQDSREAVFHMIILARQSSSFSWLNTGNHHIGFLKKKGWNSRSDNFLLRKRTEKARQSLPLIVYSLDLSQMTIQCCVQERPGIGL